MSWRFKSRLGFRTVALPSVLLVGVVLAGCGSAPSEAAPPGSPVPTNCVMAAYPTPSKLDVVDAVRTGSPAEQSEVALMLDQLPPGARVTVGWLGSGEVILVNTVPLPTEAEDPPIPASPGVAPATNFADPSLTLAWGRQGDDYKAASAARCAAESSYRLRLATWRTEAENTARTAMVTPPPTALSAGPGYPISPIRALMLRFRPLGQTQRFLVVNGDSQSFDGRSPRLTPPELAGLRVMVALELVYDDGANSKKWFAGADDTTLVAIDRPQDMMEILEDKK